MVTVNLPPFSSTSSPPFPWARAIPDLPARFDTPNLRALLKTLGPKTLAKGEQPRLDAKCRCGEKEEGNEWKGEWQVVARQAREGEHWSVLNNFAIASHFAAKIWISLSLARLVSWSLQLLSTQLDKKSSILIHCFRIRNLSFIRGFTFHPIMGRYLYQGYPSTGIFLYFQILATYFWLDL